MSERTIDYRVMVDWDRNGTFVDETPYLISASGDWNTHSPATNVLRSKSQISEAKVTLSNHDRRYSNSSASPIEVWLDDNRIYQCPVYIELNVDGVDWHRIFTGVLKTGRESFATPTTASTFEITCRGNEDTVINARTSTFHWQFRNTWGESEAEVIKDWLQAVGLVDGVHFDSTTIDHGRIALDFAWLDDESPVEDCWELAAGAAGRFYAGPDGKFYYDNVTDWVWREQQLVLDRTQYQSVSSVWNDKELASEVSVEYNTRGPGADESDLWRSDELVSIGPGETVTVEAALSKPVARFIDVRYDAVSSGGGALGDDLEILVNDWYAQRTITVLRNNGDTHSIELRNLRVVGTPLLGGPTGSAEGIEDTGGWWAGRQPRKLSEVGNVYVQGPIQAELLASILINRLEYPERVYTVAGFPGDPTLWLGDRLTILDTQHQDVGVECFLTGISWQLSGSGFYQTLKLIDGRNIFPWGPGPDNNGYFVCGESLLGFGNNRLFY